MNRKEQLKMFYDNVVIAVHMLYFFVKLLSFFLFSYIYNIILHNEYQKKKEYREPHVCMERKRDMIITILSTLKCSRQEQRVYAHAHFRKWRHISDTLTFGEYISGCNASPAM